MHANEREYVDKIVKAIIGAAYKVSNQLGSGFLEKVYERALAIELREQGLKVKTQFAVPVQYKGNTIGTYVADMLVADKILLELKCVECFTKDHLAQCINYLKATNLNICLLINFQCSKLEWKRVVYNF